MKSTLPRFDQAKMLRLVETDMYLTFVWNDFKSRVKSQEDALRYLEALFNSTVLEDSVMMNLYKKA